MALDRNISLTKRLKNNNTDLIKLTLTLGPITEIYYYEHISYWTIKSFSKYKERICFSSKKFFILQYFDKTGLGRIETHIFKELYTTKVLNTTSYSMNRYWVSMLAFKHEPIHRINVNLDSYWQDKCFDRHLLRFRSWVLSIRKLINVCSEQCINSKL